MPLDSNALPIPAVIRLAVDCMGGDHGPAVTLPACRAFLGTHPEAGIVLVGREADLVSASAWERCAIVHATEVIEMNDPIEIALRKKKDSSLRVALSLVKADEQGVSRAQACVSAGNTGALMALSRYVLKTLEGIDRPAIAAVLPNQKDGFTTVLDLGANVDCTPENLLQFAIMGSALVAAVGGNENPSVGLLNIGEEAMKGNEVIKQAAELLRVAAAGGHLNFYGNVEGNDVFKGTTDIVVCDGFVGNVLLKAAEGLAAMLTAFIKQEFRRNVFTKLAAVVALPVMNHFKRRVDHRRYSGGALLGLRGLVFKAHGGSDAYAFEQALNRAYDAASNCLLDRVHDRIVETLAAMPGTAGSAAPAAAEASLSA